MTKAEEIFNIKAEYNKWLKELTDDEKELILEMINEALRQQLVSRELADFARFLSEEYSIEIHERIIDEWNKYYSANYR
jgi:hypothetical protein